MLLIISGQYLESELYAEFGKIPPSFLPLGNRRLYTHQITQLASSYDRIALTVPSDFKMDYPDVAALADLGVPVHCTAVGSALGPAIREALDDIAVDGRIDILYGDTLVYMDELGGTDWIGVGSSDDFYPWHYENGPASATKARGAPNADGIDGQAWAGMFSFSSASALRRMLDDTDDFIAAVTRYGREYAQLERRSLRHWLDFGHVHTYFRSRLAVTTQRHFNELSITDGVLTKSSTDRLKMTAEARWFETAPAAVRPFLPNFISADCSAAPSPASYSIEYLPLTSLNELYVFGRLPTKVWQKVFGACDRYMRAERAVPLDGAPPDHASRLYREKTLARLQVFSAQSGIDIDRPWTFCGATVPSLVGMAEEAAAAVAGVPACPSFVHGDFCFSNILYDFRSDRVKLIDPRGLDVDGRATSFGDFRYDIGKLAHSVLGLYDVVLAGHFDLRIEGHDVSFELFHEHSAATRQAFAQTRFAGRTPDEWDCQPVMLLLFLSMLALHADSPRRQRALMANAMRIYKGWTR